MRGQKISSRRFSRVGLGFFANVAGRNEWLVFCRFRAQVMFSREAFGKEVGV